MVSAGDRNGCCASSPDHFTGKFLLLALAQMTPLAITDMTILQCKSPLRQFCVFSEKVFLMNASFLALRILTFW